MAEIGKPLHRETVIPLNNPVQPTHEPPARSPPSFIPSRHPLPTKESEPVK